MAQEQDSVEITLRHKGKVETYLLKGAGLDAVEETRAFDASALFPDREGMAHETTLRIHGISGEGRFISATIQVTTPPPIAAD